MGSDQSVALWRTPLHKNLNGSDPTNHLIGRFRKTGNLGHFLTPTSVTWLSDVNHFAVSYSESVISIYEAQTGNEVSEMVVPCEGKEPVLSQINKIVVDPSSNLLIAGTEDLKLLFFDLHSQ